MIKIIKKALSLLLILLTPLIFTYCSEDNTGESETINTDKINIKLKFRRFDEAIFKAKNAQEIAELEKQFPDFYPVYMYQLMGDITQTDENPLEAAVNLMRNFTTVAEFGLGLKQRADSVFPNFDDFKDELSVAMKRYSYFFPKDTIPEFITFISPLRINFPIIEGKNQIGIGLDMYLGSDYKPYHSYQLADQFPAYRIRKMRKEYLLRDLITALCVNKLKPIGSKARLLDEMIYEGKIAYMVKSILPQTPDSIIMGYTPAQLDWANDNTSEIWASLVDSKVLYITEPEEIRHYINDAPFTTAKGYGAGTAPRIGSYTGLQILSKYSATYPKLTLQQILDEMDADMILSKSKYKP